MEEHSTTAISTITTILHPYVRHTVTTLTNFHAQQGNGQRNSRCSGSVRLLLFLLKNTVCLCRSATSKRNTDSISPRLVHTNRKKSLEKREFIPCFSKFLYPTNPFRVFPVEICVSSPGTCQTSLLYSSSSSSSSAGMTRGVHKPQ